MLARMEATEGDNDLNELWQRTCASTSLITLAHGYELHGHLGLGGFCPDRRVMLQIASSASIGQSKVSRQGRIGIEICRRQ